MTDDLLTTREAALLLGLDASSVRRLIKDGHMPAKRLGDRAWMIRRGDLHRAEGRPRRGRPRKHGPRESGGREE